MFLYGMRVMGDGLKSSSGGVLKAALAKVTANPALGFLFGMLITCMIQSSTATIVLTVGLVGAGLLDFRQSIGIVLGANVGTAITAQIIRLMDLSAGSGSLLYFFKADNLAPLALTIGIVCIMFIKNEKSKKAGGILVGFGILFMGLIYMSSAVSTMGDALSGLLTSFEDNYFLGFLSGIIVTGVIQSSSAVVGILQSMASSVGVRFCGVFAVIIGVNIGDCLTTFLVSRIGAKPNQIRTAMVHVIYNIFAAALIIVVLTIGRGFGIIPDSIWYASLNSGGVANVHGLFRLVPALVLLPLTNVFAGIAEKLVPDAPVEEEDALIESNLKELDSRLITNPTIALGQVSTLISHMADVAVHNYDAVSQQIFTYEAKRDERIQQREELLDRMADASNRYLVDVSAYISDESDSRNADFQIKALTCFERIGDHAVNMTDDIKALRDNNSELSEIALRELTIALDAIKEILTVTTHAYKNGDLMEAERVEPLEEVIDDLIETLRGRHINRMKQGKCDIYTGIQYENILTNLERVSDQCSDLAVFMLSHSNRVAIGEEHKYLHELHHSDNAAYQTMFQSKFAKFFGQLDALREEEEAGTITVGAAQAQMKAAAEATEQAKEKEQKAAEEAQKKLHEQETEADNRDSIEMRAKELKDKITGKAAKAEKAGKSEKSEKSGKGKSGKEKEKEKEKDKKKDKDKEKRKK